MPVKAIWLGLESLGGEGAVKYGWPGVYKIRIVDANGAPVIIGRFLGSDKDGILAIGESKNIAHRLRQFYRAVNGKEFKHSVANRFFLIRYIQSLRGCTFSNGVLEYTAYKLENKAKARSEEERLLKTYFKIFGELPPLNGDMPDNSNLNWANL
jgi:hypothetical protein